jgi:hypothetical protein
MASSSKRQTTMAKFSREQALRERRARKQEKKDDRKQAALGLGVETSDEPDLGESDDLAAADAELPTP